MTAAVETGPIFRLRSAQPDDRRFVLSTWRRAEAECSAHKEGRLFPAWQDRMMADILQRPGTSIRIASPEGDDAIVGWAVIGFPVGVSAPTVVYYVFVRPEARRFGVASMLLDDLRERRDVIYPTLPARICATCGDAACKNRQAHRAWVNSPIRPPRLWHYMPRANFYEAMEQR